MPFTAIRTASFSETDASGRVHFTQILKWIEDAEHQFLESAGVPVFTAEGGWPRVSIKCDYKAPLEFGEEVSVILILSKIGESSLNWEFRIEKAGHNIAAEGSMVTVYVAGSRSSSLPTTIRDLLKIASAE